MCTKPFNLVSLVLLLAGATAGAQETPRFTLDTPESLRPACKLIALDETGTIHVEDAGERRSFKQMIELRQDGRKLPPLLTRNFVLLSNGDRWPLDPNAAAKLDKSRLLVWPAPGLSLATEKGLSLFAPNVVLVFWSVPDGIDDPERFFTQLQAEPRKRDIAFLKNGDQIEGTLAELDGKVGCVIQSDGRRVQTPWSKLAGIAWSTERQARLKTKSAYFRAVLDGGARVNLLDLRFDEKSRRWLGKTQFGAALDLPEASLIAFDVRQGQSVDLSDLEPAKYEHRPYLGVTWPLVKDAAATGQPLRLQGDTFEKGLGAQASCKVTYKLDGKYERFDVVVGIDEPSRRGRAKVAIEVEGKRIDLNDGKELTAQTSPIAVRLDVKKAGVLTLIVEAGAFGDVQANVNWAKARLIKKSR
jgi:hypothetical protein